MIHDIDFPEEESQVRINFPNSEPLLVDTIELHWIIRDSLLESGDGASDIEYIDVVRKNFKSAFGRDISRSQANFLIRQVRLLISDLKKNSSQSQELLDITDQLSQLTDEDSNSSNSASHSSEQKKNSGIEKFPNPLHQTKPTNSPTP